MELEILLECMYRVMKKEQYAKILKENLKQSAVKVTLGRRFVFQHNNDSKHTSYLVKNYLLKAKILNPIENMWGELKSRSMPENLQICSKWNGLLKKNGLTFQKIDVCNW